MYGAELAAGEALGIPYVEEFQRRYVLTTGKPEEVLCLDCGQVATVEAGRQLTFPHADYCATTVIRGAF